MRLQVQYYRLEEECSSPRHRLAGPVTATQRRLELLRQRVTAVGFEVRQESTVRQGHMGLGGHDLLISIIFPMRRGAIKRFSGRDEIIKLGEQNGVRDQEGKEEAEAGKSVGKLLLKSR